MGREPRSEGRRGRPRSDLRGRRFGRWLVVRAAAHDARGPTAWLCHCSCGTERVLATHALQRRQTISCGCVPRGRPRTADRARRDKEILAARRRGERLAVIAARFGISSQRVHQIIRAAGEARPGDRRRA